MSGTFCHPCLGSLNQDSETASSSATPQAGLASVTLDADEFRQAGVIWHELEVALPSGEDFTLARGEFRSLPALLPAAPQLTAGEG